VGPEVVHMSRFLLLVCQGEVRHVGPQIGQAAGSNSCEPTLGPQHRPRPLMWWWRCGEPVDQNPSSTVAADGSKSGKNCLQGNQILVQKVLSLKVTAQKVSAQRYWLHKVMAT